MLPKLFVDPVSEVGEMGNDLLVSILSDGQNDGMILSWCWHPCRSWGHDFLFCENKANDDLFGTLAGRPFDEISLRNSS